MSVPRVRLADDRLELAGLCLSASEGLRLGKRLIESALNLEPSAAVRSAVANALLPRLALDCTLDQDVDLDQYLKEKEEPEPEVTVLCEAKPNVSPTPTRSTAPLQNRDALSLLLRKG